MPTVPKSPSKAKKYAPKLRPNEIVLALELARKRRAEEDIAAYAEKKRLHLKREAS